MKAWLAFVSLCLHNGDCWSLVGDFNSYGECETWLNEWHEQNRKQRFIALCTDQEDMDFYLDARDSLDELIRVETDY